MPSSTERQARPLSRKARENLRQEEGTDLPSAPTRRTWREKPKTEGERQGKRRREAQRQLRRKGSQGKGTRAKAKGEEKQAEPEGKGPESKAKGTDKPAEPKGVPPPRKGQRYSKKVRDAMAASQKVAKAIREAPWRNPEEEEEERGEGAGEDPSRDPPGARPRMGKSKILGAALAGMLRAQEDA